MALIVKQIQDLMELYAGQGGVAKDRLNPVLMRTLINFKLREFINRTGVIGDKITLTTIANCADYKLPYGVTTISEVHVDGTKATKLIHSQLIETTGTVEATEVSAMQRYLWKKVQLSDVETVQTLTTGSGELTYAKLDSLQGELPDFTNATLQVNITNPYQDRMAYIAVEETVVAGEVTFGVMLSKGGVTGTPYFDIEIWTL